MSDDKNIFGDDDNLSGDFQFDSSESNDFAQTGQTGFGEAKVSDFEEQSFESDFQQIQDDPYAAPSGEMDEDLQSMVGADPDLLQDEEFVYGQEVEGQIYEHVDEQTEPETASLNRHANQAASQQQSQGNEQAAKTGIGKIVGFSLLGLFGAASLGATAFLFLDDDSTPTAAVKQPQTYQQLVPGVAQADAMASMGAPSLSPLPDAALQGDQLTNVGVASVTPNDVIAEMQMNDPLKDTYEVGPEPNPLSVRPIMNKELGVELASLQSLVNKQDERIDSVNEKVDGVISEVKALKGQLASLESKIDKLAATPAPKVVNAEKAAPKSHNSSKPAATIAQTSKKVPATTTKPTQKAEANSDTWYVRGVTAERAIIYREKDGLAYTVSVGKEVPGFGEVVKLRPDLHEVHTAKGVIKRKISG